MFTPKKVYQISVALKNIHQNQQHKPGSASLNPYGQEKESEYSIAKKLTQISYIVLYGAGIFLDLFCFGQFQVNCSHL